MASKEERIEVALDTLAEICKMTPEQLDGGNQYERRAAAEEILRHYREETIFDRMSTQGILVKIEGHLPVRATTTAQTR